MVVGAAVLLIALAPVLLPVLAVTLLGHRADRPLAALNAFATRHARQINAGICLFFAVWLGWSGFRGLTG